MQYLSKLFLALSLVFSLAQAKEFVIDNTHTNVGFSIKHMMISNVKGNFTTYSGEIDFDVEKNAFTKLSAKIDAGSVNTGISKRDEHLRSADFFDATKHKTIDFVMTSTKADTIYGKLTIRGVTKDVALKQTIHGVIKDFQGLQRLGFTLEGKINRKEFGLTWNKLLETGGLTVGEDVLIVVDIEAIELKK